MTTAATMPTATSPRRPGSETCLGITAPAQALVLLTNIATDAAIVVLEIFIFNPPRSK
jgi:hypothetical protein